MLYFLLVNILNAQHLFPHNITPEDILTCELQIFKKKKKREKKEKSRISQT